MDEDYWFIQLIIESILCLIITILLYLYYVRKGTNIIVSLISIFTWFLTFVLVILLPFDLTYSQEYNNLAKKKPPLKEEEKIMFKKLKEKLEFITNLYAFDYWFIFILSWIIIPIIQEYEKSGYFDKKSKLKDAIKSNLLFFGIAFILGIILYIFIGIKFEIWNPITLMNIGKGLSISWGLLQVFFFMGFSIIKLPKDLYSHYKYINEEKYLEWKITELNDNLIDLQFKFNKHYNKLKNIKGMIDKSSNSPLLPYKKNINELYSYLEKNNQLYEKVSNIKEDIKLVNNEKDLIKLNKKIKREVIDFQRTNYLQNEIYQKWLLIVSIRKLEYDNKINNNDNEVKNEDINEYLKPDLDKNMKYLELNLLSKFYYLYIRQIFIILLFGIIILFELLIIFLEIIACFNLDINLFEWIYYDKKKRLLSHFISISQVLFLFFLCFYSLFQMKISFLCRMYGNKQTDSLSILFISNIMCNIGFPICINFSQISKNNSSKIYSIYGAGKFGDSIEHEGKKIYEMILRFFPFELFLLIGLNFFNVFNKIGDCMGFNSFTIKNEDTNKNIDDGKNTLLKMNKVYGNDFIKIGKEVNKIEII